MSFNACTTLSGYKALEHVFSYASQQKKDALAVVYDGIQGGLLKLMSWQAEEDDVQYSLLPSSALISAIASLTVQGFFSPLPPCSEGDVCRVESEPFPRDSFTAIILLFPDCFADPQTVWESGEGTSSGDTSLHSSPMRHLRSRSCSVGNGDFQVDGKVQSCGNWEGMMEVREEVAVSYLSALNFSLHDIKIRQAKLGHTDQSPSSSASELEAVKLGTLTHLLERLKAVLALCLASSAVCRGSNLSSSTLFAQASGGYFHAAFESQPQAESEEEHETWLDTQMSRASECYEAHYKSPHCPTLQSYIARIQKRSHRLGRAISLPSVTLSCPRDGSSGAIMNLDVDRFDPALPHLPIQLGEVIPVPVRGIDLESKVSPLSLFLTRCIQRKLSGLNSELTTHFPSSVCELNIHEVSILRNFLCCDTEVAECLEKNVDALTHIILWISKDSEKSRGLDEAAHATVRKMMFTLPFSVSFGVFVRTLVMNDYITKDNLVEWVTHCCTVADPSQYGRSFFVLIDFALARLQCDLPLDVTRQLQSMKVASFGGSTS